MTRPANRFGAWGVVLGVLAGLALMALLVPLADLLRPLALMLPRTGAMPRSIRSTSSSW